MYDIFFIFIRAIHFTFSRLLSYIPFFRPTKEEATMTVAAVMAITTTRTTRTAIIILTRNRKDRLCDAVRAGLATKVRLLVVVYVITTHSYYLYDV